MEKPDTTKLHNVEEENYIHTLHSLELPTVSVLNSDIDFLPTKGTSSKSMLSKTQPLCNH